MDTRRALSAAGLSGAAAALAALGGVSWYYSSRLTQAPADVWPPEPRADDRVHIRATRPGAIVLEGAGADRGAVWGLSWEGGYGQVAEVVDREGEFVARTFRQFEGDAPPDDDTPAVLDTFAYPPDPALLGLPWEDVTYRTELGPAPAWWFPAERDTWVVFVHGRQARRHESFRIVPTLHDLGLPVLSIAYRNDPDAPRSPDGRSHLGATEWRDVEAAVTYAIDAGARRVVLFGVSMGGGCIVNYLRESDRSELVCATILEAPVLAWRPVIRQAAIDRGLPASLLPLLLPPSMALAGARAGIDWQRMNHLDEPSRWQHPGLLIHGDADPVVPVELADTLAQARPDIVSYLRVPGAGHGRSWNTDPDLYTTTVRDFLTEALER